VRGGAPPDPNGRGVYSESQDHVLGGRRMGVRETGWLRGYGDGRGGEGGECPPSVMEMCDKPLHDVAVGSSGTV
jgi:hypothetical protein